MIELKVISGKDGLTIETFGEMELNEIEVLLCHILNKLTKKYQEQGMTEEQCKNAVVINTVKRAFEVVKENYAV